MLCYSRTYGVAGMAKNARATPQHRELTQLLQLRKLTMMWRSKRFQIRHTFGSRFVNLCKKAVKIIPSGPFSDLFFVVC